jgi:hypothetical protein
MSRSFEGPITCAGCSRESGSVFHLLLLAVAIMAVIRAITPGGTTPPDGGSLSGGGNYAAVEEVSAADALAIPEPGAQPATGLD